MTSKWRHVPAGNLAPIAPPPPNILNLGPHQYSKPSYALLLYELDTLAILYVKYMSFVCIYAHEPYGLLH